MGLSDFYLCDLCSSKTFYDARLSYDGGNENPYTHHPWPDGEVGGMLVICKECAKHHKVQIVYFGKDTENREFHTGRIFKEERTLIEKLADIEHQRWSRWHEYAFSNWTPNRVDHWNVLAKIPYSDLSEEVKQKDRDEVMKYWPLILGALKAKEREVLHGEAVKHLAKYVAGFFFDYELGDFPEQIFEEAYKQGLEEAGILTRMKEKA